MKPAADRLADIKLPEAVPPEQEALQHLIRAESLFTDIQVSFQRNGFHFPVRSTILCARLSSSCESWGIL